MACSGCQLKATYKSGVEGRLEMLSTHDWMSELPNTSDESDIVEVRFKGTHKAFYRNTNKLDLYRGDIVVVGTSPGHDVGFVSLTGKMAYLQYLRKTNVKHRDNHQWQPIFRIATEADMERWEKARQREKPVLIRSRQIAKDLELNMKISEVEFRGDNSKATFYYIADGRVDFRELIKKYASEFRIKVEMRQIGHRQEAAMVGGIGSCGRELCCSSWRTDFSSITTNMASIQGLSPNAEKLAGSCGKLKCCLIYELDTYLEAQKDFPKELLSLDLQEGVANHFKTDLLQKKITYFAPGKQGYFTIDLKKVRSVIQKNKMGKRPTLAEVTFDHAVSEKSENETNMFNQNLSHVEAKDTKPHRRKKSGNRNRKNRSNRQKNDSSRQNKS